MEQNGSYFCEVLRDERVVECEEEEEASSISQVLRDLTSEFRVSVEKDLVPVQLCSCVDIVWTGA